MNLEEIRNRIPILKNYVYLNTARFGPMPDMSIEIQQRYLQHLSTNGSWEFDEWLDKYETARVLSAQLLSVPSNQVFFSHDVSTIINIAASELNLQKVILLEGDFPSVTIPWKERGYDITWMDYDQPGFYDRLHDEFRKGHAAFCSSWIQSEDGFEIDLGIIAEWSKAYDVPLIIDGTQGVGSIPFSPPDCEVIFVASGFKWLLAGYGIALGYVTDGLLPTIRRFAGWNSMDHETRQVRAEAASLEAGNAPYLTALSLGESLEMLLKYGIENIFERNLRLKDHLISLLTEHNIDSISKSERSSILRIQSGSFLRLKKQHIQVTNGRNWIRTSHHFFNTEEELQTLVNYLVEAK
jgi:selenocysteine lyase/cysteine desulfurase